MHANAMADLALRMNLNAGQAVYLPIIMEKIAREGRMLMGQAIAWADATADVRNFILSTINKAMA